MRKGKVVDELVVSGGYSGSKKTNSPLAGLVVDNNRFIFVVGATSKTKPALMIQNQ